MKTKQCRVGVVDHFPARKAGCALGNHGYVGLKAKLERWTVQYMDGTVLRVSEFHSENMAKSFWESLPEYN